ncbi:VWA domain-containing protein [Actinoplanes sp. URMC 104]|uniref:VWA domain-containing protein n=1 Tax=Actinoplanes sp. URMC 104 TaxID=3423409 RepID=UPI003F198CFD
MTVLLKGANTALGAMSVLVTLTWKARPDAPHLDVSALLLTPEGTVRGPGDFVFYNAPRHASGAVRHLGKQAPAGGVGFEGIEVELGAVEPGVDRIVIAASTDGEPIGRVPQLTLLVSDAGLDKRPLVRFDDMQANKETAFAVGEFYRRAGGWKFRAVGQGWDTGLTGLATAFGIVVETPTPVSLSKADRLVRLEKSLADCGDRHLLDLTKRAGVSLSKRGLQEHTARVAICLDISASMADLYDSGKVQAFAERVLALGMRFDDDASIDCFLFGVGSYEAGTMTPQNYRTHLRDILAEYDLEGGTYYGDAINLMRRYYFGSGVSGPESVPVYVMFLTDGADFDEDATRDEIRASSREPMFIQFMGISQASSQAVKPVRRGLFGRRTAPAPQPVYSSEFAFLEELDEMPDRMLDNTNFFAVSDPIELGDDELFDLLMTEYPDWLAQARARRIVG